MRKKIIKKICMQHVHTNSSIIIIIIINTIFLLKLKLNPMRLINNFFF